MSFVTVKRDIHHQSVVGVRASTISKASVGSTAKKHQSSKSSKKHIMPQLSLHASWILILLTSYTDRHESSTKANKIALTGTNQKEKQKSKILKNVKNIQRSLQVSKLRQCRIVLLLHKHWQINTFQKSLKSRQWRRMVRLSRQTIPRLYNSITGKMFIYVDTSIHRK